MCMRKWGIVSLRRHYWIHDNSASRNIMKECVICQQNGQKPGKQKMSDLPTERVSMDHRPLTYAGMDYFGPIESKWGRSTVKRYGVIFTCLTEQFTLKRPILSIDSCINAIRKFLCRQEQVKEIRSDNGTGFVSASRELKKALKVLNQRLKITESKMALNGHSTRLMVPIMVVFGSA